MASITEQLKELAELRDAGVLTDDEFGEQKRALLATTRTGISGTPSDPTMLQVVGAYRLLGLIGEGGMGAVYRGRHRSEAMAARQGGDVAVKVIHAQYARNPDYRDRFEREAAVGFKLDHPGIVKVHDLVADGGYLALVMDRVEGSPLSRSIGEAVGPISWDEAWPLFGKLLVAVGHAHDEGVVHRDIKPENILVTPDGEPRVIDFGIAKDIHGSATRTGTGMGTVEYMAPEQYTDAKTVDRRADVYSLGMILYEMLAGRLPWEADAPQFEILEQKARKELMSPSAFCPDIPPGVVAALSPALAGDPGDRPKTTALFAAKLDEANELAAAREEAGELPRQPEDVDQVARPREAAERKRRELERWRGEEMERQRRLEQSWSAGRAEQDAYSARASSRGSPAARELSRRIRRRILISCSIAAVLLIVILAVSTRWSPASRRSTTAVEAGGPSAGRETGAVGMIDTSSEQVADRAIGVRESNPAGLQWVGVPGGTFRMGWQDGFPAEKRINGHLVPFFDDEKPAHDVTVRPFEMSGLEVTVDQFRSCVEDGACASPGQGEHCRYGLAGMGRHPMNCVTWFEARTFAEWAGGRLPTEAEWEFAARGGEQHLFAGSGSWEDVVCGDSLGMRQSCLVGSKEPNGYGLYDMSGSVWEWCLDWYGPYSSEASVDPAGPATGSERVMRGGSSGAADPTYLQVTSRIGHPPSTPRDSGGFRVARDLP